jgi:hypothetical protein
MMELTWKFEVDDGKKKLLKIHATKIKQRRNARDFGKVQNE